MQAKNRKPFQVTTGAVIAAPFLRDEYLSKPCYVVETSAGKVFARIHDADNVALESYTSYAASSAAGRGYVAQADRDAAEYLTVRGVEYQASVCYSGPYDEGLTHDRISYFHATRRGGFSQDDVSYPARDSLRDIFLAALAAIYREHGSPPFAIARALSAQDASEKLADKVREAEETLAKLRAELSAAKSAEQEAVQAVERRGVSFAPWSRKAEGGGK